MLLLLPVSISADAKCSSHSDWLVLVFCWKKSLCHDETKRGLFLNSLNPSVGWGNAEQFVCRWQWSSASLDTEAGSVMVLFSTQKQGKPKGVPAESRTQWENVFIICLSASCCRRELAGAGHKAFLGDWCIFWSSPVVLESHCWSWIFFPSLFVFCTLAVNANTQPGLK